MKFEKCILCLTPLKDKTPPEHIIPHSLGGRLKHELLCNKCNHGIGAKLYSTIKFDAHIRKTVFQMRNELPKIFESVESQQRYTTKSPIGTELEAIRRKRGIQIVPVSNGNEKILPTDNAISFMQKHLVEDYGQDNKTATKIASRIKETPNNLKVALHGNLSIVRWDGDNFKADFSKNGISDKNAMILIAYEYLSLLLGKTIYEEAFDHVRETILSQGDNPNLKVNFFLSPKPQPFHLIYPEFETDRTRINIHLFESLIIKVELINLKVSNSPDFCYLEDLVNRTSFGAMSVAEGKSKQWREFDN